MGRPHLGQAKAKIKTNIAASETMTYRVSAWLSAEQWDDQMGGFTKASPEEQEAIKQIHGILHRNQIKIRISVDQRAGDEPKEWPTVARFTLNPNEPEESSSDEFTI